MKKTNYTDTDVKLTVDITGLQQMLCIGKNSASEVGEKAGAIVRIGRRKLYNVKKIEAYINSMEG